MRVLFVFPPAKASNEVDTYRAVPGIELIVLGSLETGRPADMELPSVGIPILGAPERWSAALRWYRGLGGLDLSGFDLVISYELGSASTDQVIRLARRWSIPHVVLHSQTLDDYPLYRLPPWSLWLRRARRSISGVISINDFCARNARHFGMEADLVHSVVPGVDTAIFTPATSLESSPTVLFLGELRADKGVLDVITACEIVADRIGSEFRLRILGDGPLRAEVEDAARTRPWIEVLGRRPREEVPDLLRSARVMTIAPWTRRLWSEQLGFALLEAMACGLPVVSTQCGAIPEVIPAPNPIVPERDCAALADGLLAALENAPDWGQRNREWVLANADHDSQARVLGHLLDSIVVGDAAH